MTAEQLLRDVAQHEMKVLRDDGVYRHLSFRKPGECFMWFEIVTWPNTLTIRGDMGSWSFSRVEDMFNFFRNSKGLAINADYWEEKCESVDTRVGPCKVFNAESYKARVLEFLDNYDLSAEERAAVQDGVEEVFRSTDETEYALYLALNDFRCGDFEFSDLWDISSKTYSYHFLWCLYAIVWGIQQYDAAKALASQPPATGITDGERMERLSRSSAATFTRVRQSECAGDLIEFFDGKNTYGGKTCADALDDAIRAERGVSRA